MADWNDCRLSFLRFQICRVSPWCVRVIGIQADGLRLHIQTVRTTADAQRFIDSFINPPSVCDFPFQCHADGDYGPGLGVIVNSSSTRERTPAPNPATSPITPAVLFSSNHRKEFP